MGRKLIKINNIKGHAHNMLLIVKHRDTKKEIFHNNYIIFKKKEKLICFLNYQINPHNLK